MATKTSQFYFLSLNVCQFLISFYLVALQQYLEILNSFPSSNWYNFFCPFLLFSIYLFLLCFFSFSLYLNIFHPFFSYYFEALITFILFFFFDLSFFSCLFFLALFYKYFLTFIFMRTDLSLVVMKAD